MIDSYLKSQVDMDDHVIHLLFSANRWEAAYDALTPSFFGAVMLRPNKAKPWPRCWRQA
jgi:hypothetical protein